jgi:hypothetical protein
MEDQTVFRTFARALTQEVPTDYSAARAKAIEWLGDRYLLAKPINQNSVTVDQRSAEVTAKLLDNFLEIPRSTLTLHVLTRQLLSAAHRRPTPADGVPLQAGRKNRLDR